MAKYECSLQGNFDEFLNVIENEILEGSISASLEDESNFVGSQIKCAVRVYERYSFLGKNRVSLNITLIGSGNNLYLSAITSGGSQAMFIKINTFGEEAFLDCIKVIVENYKNSL